MTCIFTRYGGYLIVPLLLTFAASFRCSADSGGAGSAAIFTTTDQNPFIQIHTLPWPVEPVPVMAGAWGLSWALDIANNSISDESSDGEQAIIDGETWRVSFRAGYGISEALTIEALIPVVSQQNGILDGFISGWHDLFGLTNSRREEFEDNNLSYLYTDPAGDDVDVQQPGTGIGDIRLSGALRLAGERRSDRQLILRAGLKLPTGDPDRLYGSGGTDLSLQILGTDRRTLSSWDTTLSWMAGMLWLGDGEVLEDRQRDAVAVGSLGLVKPLNERLQLKAQLDAHGSFYDSDLDVIGSSAVQLVIGGGLSIGSNRWLDFGIVENLSQAASDTTPDFVVHIAVHTLL